MEKTAPNFSYAITIITPPVQVYAVEEDDTRTLLATFETSGQHTFLATTRKTDLIGGEHAGLTGPLTTAAVIGLTPVAGTTGGQSGADGLSAYELAVQQGYDGTLDDWLASLKGDQGDPGPQGPKGADAVVDQTYSPDSENAMSGKAVAEALKGVSGGGGEGGTFADTGHITGGTANDAEATAVGANAHALGECATAVGGSSMAAADCLAIGWRADADSSQSTAVGKCANAFGGNATAVGAFSGARKFESVAVGCYAEVSADRTTAVGTSASASGAGALAIGHGVKATAEKAIAVGFSTQASAYHSMAFGFMAQASEDKALALGTDARAEADRASAIGGGCYVADEGTLALNAGGRWDGKSTQLYLIAAGTPLANTYTNGEAGLGYVVLDHLSGQVVERGCISLASLCVWHTHDFSPKNVTNISEY